MSFKTREAHWEIIVNFMECHRELATGGFTGPNGRRTQKQLWEELGGNLNALGFGERSADKWQKTWTDYKYLLKKKASAKKLDLGGTGGGEMTVSFTDIELRLLNLLGDSFYKGVGSKEIGVTLPVKSIPANNEKIPFRTTGKDKLSRDENTEPGPSRIDHDYLPNQKKRKKEDMEMEAFEQTINVLNEIKNVVDEGLKNINTSISVLIDTIITNKNK